MPNLNVWNENKLVILLDNGHGMVTPGKRSPDSSFFEYEFNRDIVDRISMALKLNGTPYHIITPEVIEDISLTERVNRVNRYCNQYGKDNCLLISVHANAAGTGQWMNARGWSVFTSKGKTKSDEYAKIFYDEANKLLPMHGQKIRADWSDGDPDWEENFTMLSKTNCPAVLTENLFMDNKEDLKFLQSNLGRSVIAQIHINAIKNANFI